MWRRSRRGRRSRKRGHLLCGSLSFALSWLDLLFSSSLFNDKNFYETLDRNESRISVYLSVKNKT